MLDNVMRRQLQQLEKQDYALKITTHKSFLAYYPRICIPVWQYIRPAGRAVQLDDSGWATGHLTTYYHPAT